MNISHLGQVNVMNVDIESAISEIKNADNINPIKPIGKENFYDDGYSKKKLDNSLIKLNKFLEDEKVHAEYSMHEDLKSIMIKIVDDNTKEVILEIPPKKILDMVASMCKEVGLLDKKA